MAKQLLSIDSFKEWIVNDETRQSNRWFVDMYWLDPWTEDGILQINKRILADTATGLVQDPLSFTYFDNKKICWTENEQMWYESTTNTWTLMHTNVNNGDNHDLTTYQDYLIYCSIDEIWISTNTTIAWWFTDNPTFTWDSNSFLNWTISQRHYFKEFNNRLYISDGNYLVELDWASAPTTPASWVLDRDKFILPVWENILSLEVIGSQMAIWTDLWNLYFWDWASANATQIVKTTLGWIFALQNLENTLFAFAWTTWTVYRYNWAELIPVIQIPNFNSSSTSHPVPASVRRYRNGMIFGIRNNGLYVYNRNSASEPFALTKYWPTAWWVDNDVLWIYVNPLSATGDDFAIAVRETQSIEQTDSTDRYRMEEAGSGDTSGAPRIDTFVYELRDNKWQPNKVQWVQWLFKWDGGVFVKNNILIEYRLNRDTTYTVLWSIWEDGVGLDKILRGIGKRASAVQLRIKFWRESNIISGRQNTKLTWLKIF